MEESENRTGILFQGMTQATSRLIHLLKTKEIGEVITDEEMALICGKDTGVTGNGYGNLTTAIHYLLRNDNKVFRRIRGADAIKRYDSNEISKAVISDIKHIRRSSSFAVKRAKCADIDKIEVESRTKFLTNLAQISAVNFLARHDTEKKLIARNVTEITDSKRLLEAFSKL